MVWHKVILNKDNQDTNNDTACLNDQRIYLIIIGLLSGHTIFLHFSKGDMA